MKKKQMRWLPVLLAVLLVLSMSGCGGGGSSGGESDGQKETPAATSETETPDAAAEEEEDADASEKETYIFTDSTGREVEIPRDLARVASGGPLANIMIYAVRPDVLVGWSSAPGEQTKKYIDEKYWDLPEYGQFYDNTGDFNREALMESDPEVIIDVGEWDEEYKKDLDALQEQIGIPVILIEANLEQTAAAYRTMGEVLGEAERGKELGDYCEEIVSDAKEKAASIPEEERVTVYYGQEDTGLSTMLSGTIHSQIYDIVGAKLVVTAEDAQVQQGGGTISLEQLAAWDPQVIMFAQGSIYDTVQDDATWSALTAIKNGTYYEIPNEPYNWLGRPPGPNRMIGIRWLGNLLYPEVFDYDIEQEVKDFFHLFYRYDLTDEEVEGLLAKSTLKAAE